MPEQPEQYLRGTGLQADRRTTARQVVFEIGEWKHRTNVVDYRGYDVKRKKIPTELRHSLEELVDEEPDRLIDYVLSTRRKIKNFEDFKKAFKEAFIKGGGGGIKLWDSIDGQEDLLMKLFAHSEIQALVTKHGEADGIRKLMRKFNISKTRARQLFKQIRVHEIQLVQQGLLPVSERQRFRIRPALAPTEAPRRLRIRQRTMEGGTVYTRAKPEPFTKPQLRYLVQRPNVPTKKLTAEFNTLFGTQRTQQSVYFKRYRELKKL